MNLLKKDFIFQDVNKLDGVGEKLSKYLKKKKIEKVKDIILNLPYSETDRSKINKINELEIGKINTIKVKVKKLYFSNRSFDITDMGLSEIPSLEKKKT